MNMAQQTQALESSEAQARSPLLSAKNAEFAYRKELVLKNISLEILPGEVLGVIGPNGSGKSTLLKALAGIIKCGPSKILYKGTDIRTMNRKDIASEVSWIPQENPMVFAFKVIDVVMMGRHPYLSPLIFESEKDFQIARAAMEMTGTSRFAQRLFNEISSGERQRVLIASAIAQEPEIMLLDEPTSALDIKYQLEILTILKTLNKSKDMSVVLALHDLHLASRFCRRLILLNDGEIFADGSPAEVLKKEILENVYGISVKIISNDDGSIMVYPEI